MNKTDGMIEKNSCSNWILKSNRWSFSWRMLFCSGKNGILVRVVTECNETRLLSRLLRTLQKTGILIMERTFDTGD